MKCVACGSQFHYCSSCGYDRACDAGYCSDSCFLGSGDLSRAKTNTKEIVDLLGDNKHLLVLFMDDYCYCEDELDAHVRKLCGVESIYT